MKLIDVVITVLKNEGIGTGNAREAIEISLANDCSAMSDRINDKAEDYSDDIVILLVMSALNHYDVLKKSRQKRKEKIRYMGGLACHITFSSTYGLQLGVKLFSDGIKNMPYKYDTELLELLQLDVNSGKVATISEANRRVIEFIESSLTMIDEDDIALTITN